jgi:hypothetical protein
MKAVITIIPASLNSRATSAMRVLLAILRRKPQVAVQAMAHVVAIEHIGGFVPSAPAL